MLKRIAILIILAVTVPGSFAGTWHKSMDEARKLAAARKQFVLVDLFADWCGWCHKMEREVFPAEVFQIATRDMVLLRLDTEDRKEGSRISQEYEVRNLPTFLLFAPDMSLAGIIRGYSPAAEFAQRIKDTRAQYEKFKASLDSEAKFKSDYPRRLGLSKELISRRAFAEAETRIGKLLLEKKLPAAVRDEAYYYLAVTQVQQKKHTVALKTVKKAMSLSPVPKVGEQDQMLAAQIYIDTGNYKAALAEYKAFKEKYPNSPFMNNVNYIVPQLESALARAQ